MVSNLSPQLSKDLFSRRQLAALTTFSDLVQEARERVKRDALIAGLIEDSNTLDTGGAGATAYADAVAAYLGLIVSKSADYRWALQDGLAEEKRFVARLVVRQSQWCGTTEDKRNGRRNRQPVQRCAPAD